MSTGCRWLREGLEVVVLTSMKMDIPFLSSTWAPGSSDTHCTSSEQSILRSAAAPVTLRRNVSASAAERRQKAAPHRRQVRRHPNRQLPYKNKSAIKCFTIARTQKSKVASLVLLLSVLCINILGPLFCLAPTYTPSNLERRSFILKDKSLYFLSLM